MTSALHVQGLFRALEAETRRRTEPESYWPWARELGHLVTELEGAAPQMSEGLRVYSSPLSHFHDWENVEGGRRPLPPDRTIQQMLMTPTFRVSVSYQESLRLERFDFTLSDYRACMDESGAYLSLSVDDERMRIALDPALIADGVSPYEAGQSPACLRVLEYVAQRFAEQLLPS